MEPIRIAIPKGSLTERLLAHLGTAGYSLHSPDALGCCGCSNGIEFVLIDRREVPHLIKIGAFNAVITGQDIELNCRTDLYMVACFGFARSTDQPTKWVLAAKKGFVMTKKAKIGCELPVFARKILKERNDKPHYHIRRIEGSEEALIHYGVVQAALLVT